jgi:hypothetical protein
MTTNPKTDPRDLSAAKTLILDAEDLMRLIEIATAHDDSFEGITIHGVARQAWEKVIEAIEVLDRVEEGKAA